MRKYYETLVNLVFILWVAGTGYGLLQSVGLTQNMFTLWIFFTLAGIVVRWILMLIIGAICALSKVQNEDEPTNRSGT